MPPATAGLLPKRAAFPQGSPPGLNSTAPPGLKCVGARRFPARTRRGRACFPTFAMMMARVTNQKLRRRMWSVRGRGTISPLFYMGKVLAPTGKAGVGKSIFPANYSWRAVKAARQVSLQVLSGGFQCGVSLIENEDLVRVSEANLHEGCRPVRNVVVNNRIVVVGVVAAIESAFCVGSHTAVEGVDTLLDSAFC